ncbi:MAG TPA: GNAT family N-acetyltransferase [Bryobacteraceae bacterium]|nr:GNAT family N-acetyltransferase [Bryobacteraceae bacterium]
MPLSKISATGCCGRIEYNLFVNEINSGVVRPGTVDRGAQAPREITIRPAAADDLDFLIESYASTRREEMQSWGWPSQQQEQFLRMQFNARRGGYAATYPLASEGIVLAAGNPVGSIIINRNESEIRLVDISILTEYRAQGIGTFLISRLIQESVESKHALRLSVFHNNRAIRLYFRLGFAVKSSDAMYSEMEYNETTSEDAPAQ